MVDIKTRLSKAKVSLVLEHPFVGTIAMNMPFIIDDSIPTACTNGKDVRFNSEFVDSLDSQELLFLVAHECLHPMLEHTLRRQGRDPLTWNHAADYVINKLLVDEKIGKMPAFGLHDNAIYAAGGGTAEGIYGILPQQEGSGSSSGKGKRPLDDCQDHPEGGDEATGEWRVKVAQAAQAAKMQGKLSAGLARLVEQVLNPIVDWRLVLHRFLTKAKMDERTWARPARRFAAQGIYMPSVAGEAMGDIVVAVDCSGSISAKVIDQFAAEISAIHGLLKPRAVHVIYFDSSVSHHDTYGPDDMLDIKPHGGGGTAFSPVFKRIDEHDINPVACVFLTDLYCNDFGDQPDYPVLWVSNGADKAPFGEVVRM